MSFFVPSLEMEAAVEITAEHDYLSLGLSDSLWIPGLRPCGRPVERYQKYQGCERILGQRADTTLQYTAPAGICSSMFARNAEERGGASCDQLFGAQMSTYAGWLLSQSLVSTLLTPPSLSLSHLVLITALVS